MKKRNERERAALFLLCLLLLHGSVFGGHMRLAWWTTLYPQSLYETGIADADEAQDETTDGETDGAEKKKTTPVRIKFRLGEWLERLFAD